MADLRYLQKRRGLWFYHRAVPAPLRAILGKRKVLISLKTHALHEARAKRIEVDYRVDRMLKDARAKLRAAISEDAATEPPIEVEDEVTYLEERLAMLLGKLRRPLVTDGIPISDAGRQYLAERQREKGTRFPPNGLRARQNAYRLFADYTDDAPIQAISRKDASSFLTAIAKLDPHWGRHPDAGKLPLEALLRKYPGRSNSMSNAALNHYASHLKTLFGWAMRNGDIEANPFAGQSRKAVSDGWSYYQDDELKALLAAATGPLRWLILIGMYSGMRLSEICTSSIRSAHEFDPPKSDDLGIRYFDVQKSKTAAGVRRVPVHSKLIEDGVLEANYKEFGAAKATKLFGRLRAKIKLTRERLSFHSLRGTFTTKLDEAGVAQADTAVILGHSRGFSFDFYSGGPGLQRLKDVIEKIRY